MEKDLKLSWLLPKFSDFQLIPHTAEQLSAWFVGALLVVTFFFLLKSFFSYGAAAIRVRWLRKQLKGLSEDSIVAKRASIVEAAEAKKGTIGHLWLEFDETLVEVKKGDSVRLYNIIDASHFFCSSTLAKGLTDNRMIAAVPGFLTAIGVIGTFVGLQLGLADLDISSGASVDDMKAGVSSVINGAKIAFLTSVWGVTLSVLFNFLEKVLEQSIRKKITALQDHIDNIFPRLSAEAQLQEISHNSLQSRESLQGLAEKIGEKMQQSLLGVTQGIQEGLEKSLEKIMAPAINKLVNETSEGNQKALEDLLEKFMDGFGKQGSEQRLSMENASGEVNNAVTGMSSAMEAFVNRLDLSQNASSEREKELISTISVQVSALVDQSGKQGRMLTEFLDKQVSRMGEKIDERERLAELREEKSQNASSEREKELISAISVQVSALVDQSGEQGRMLTQFLDKQVSRMGEKIDERERLAELREEKLAGHLQTQVTTITDKVARQSDVMTQFANDQIANLISSMNERDKQVASIDQVRSEAIHKQVEQLGQSTNTLLSSIEDSIGKQQSAAQDILNQGRGLQQSVESSIHASVEATTGMKESARELRVAADSMNVLSSHIRDAGNKLSGAISEAVDSTKDLASQNQQSSLRIEALRDELINNVEQFNSLASRIDNMIQNVDQSFTTLKVTQTDFLNEQKAHVSDLSKQMATLLSDYSSQANSQTANHLKIWSESTTQYAEQMNSAARTLSSVVDEIQEKVA